MSWGPIVESALEWIWRLLGVVTRIRVRAHLAVFVGPLEQTGPECCFVTVTNLSLTKEVEVTHVWFDCPGGQVPAQPAERPLPVRLKPQEAWETWVSIDKLDESSLPDIESRARVRLSDGRIAKGKLDPSVPHYGTVPGHRKCESRTPRA